MAGKTNTVGERTAEAAKISCVDERSMPYLIFNFQPPNDTRSRGKNNDHSWCLRGRPEFTDDAGKALLKSRVQLTHIHWNDAKRDAFPDGIQDLPQTRFDKLTALSLSYARYRAWQALDLRDTRNPGFVDLTPEQHEMMAHPSQLFIERRWDIEADNRPTQREARRDIAAFVTSYCLEQFIEELRIHPLDLNRFTSADNPYAIGESILPMAIEIAAAPLVPIFTNVANEGLIDQTKSDPSRILAKMATLDNQASNNVIGQSLAA